MVHCGSILSSLYGIYQSLRSQVQNLTRGFFSVLVAKLGLSLEDQTASPIVYSHEDTDGDGTIAISNRQGVLSGFYDIMVREGYYVSGNTITFSGYASGGTNVGRLVSGSMTGLSHALSGQLTLTMTNDSVSRPELSVVNTLTTMLPDGAETIEGTVNLVPEHTYESGELGMTLLLNRPGLASPTLGNNGTPAIVSGCTVATPSDSDGDFGIYYCRVKRQATGPTWLLEFFNSASCTTKVGSTTASGTTGTVAINKVLRSDTELTFTFHKANAATNLPAAGSTLVISIDIKTPRLGDWWTAAVANNEAGTFATKSAHNWRWSPPVTGLFKFDDTKAASVAMS